MLCACVLTLLAEQEGKVDSFEELFDSVDHDKSGSIGRLELVDALENMGLEFTKCVTSLTESAAHTRVVLTCFARCEWACRSEQDRIFDHLDVDNDGTIDRDEFVAFCKRACQDV